MVQLVIGLVIGVPVGIILFAMIIGDPMSKAF
jgi:hypothetical protein